MFAIAFGLSEECVSRKPICDRTMGIWTRWIFLATGSHQLVSQGTMIRIDSYTIALVNQIITSCHLIRRHFSRSLCVVYILSSIGHHILLDFPETIKIVHGLSTDSRIHPALTSFQRRCLLAALILQCSDPYFQPCWHIVWIRAKSCSLG